MFNLYQTTTRHRHKLTFTFVK